MEEEKIRTRKADNKDTDDTRKKKRGRGRKVKGRINVREKMIPEDQR